MIMTKEKKCEFMYSDYHELAEDTLAEIQKILKHMGVNLYDVYNGQFYKLAFCRKGVSKKEAEILWDKAHPEEFEDD